MKESFVLYHEYEAYFKVLSDSEGMQLLMAIFAYECRGEEIALDGMAKAFFMVIKNSLDRNREKYIGVCEKRSQAGKQGGRPTSETENNSNQSTTKVLSESTSNQDKAKKANAFSESTCNQDKAKKADNVPVPENDHEPVPEENTSKATASDETLSETPEKVIDEQALILASLLFRIHQEHYDPKFKKTPNQIRAWADDIEKINRIDNRTWEEIEAVIRWSKADQFWYKNIMSGSKLRAQFDTLIVQMTQKTQPRASPGGNGQHWDSGKSISPKRTLGVEP